MKKIIYSKKHPKKEKSEYIQDDFIELINRKTENEFWADVFESKYRSELFSADDLYKLRDKHIKTCIEFADKKEIDAEVLKGPECTCVNLSFDGMLDLSDIKESIAFSDRVLLISDVGDREMTLSLTFQTHKIVFFKKEKE